MSAQKLANGPDAPQIRSLPIAELRRDSGTQPRAGLIEETVAEYAEAMAAGDAFPPVLVVSDGNEFWLADGFHRVEAAARVGHETIEAEVRVGTKRDTLLAAAGANATHGLRRTNADKRRAVALLLGDEEWNRWSDREIARRCGVSHPFVSALRTELSGNGCQMDAARRLVERGGTTYEMATGRIGARARLAELEAVIERGRQEAAHCIQKLEDLGITLTPTSATFPPGLPFEKWKQIGALLVDLQALAAGLHGFEEPGNLEEV